MVVSKIKKNLILM